MININELMNTAEQYDNIITINGVDLPVKVSDEMVTSIVTMVMTGKISAAIPRKDKEAKYEIVKIGKVYCIQEKTWHSDPVHKAANELIKALPNIVTIDAPNKKGSGSYKAWGYTDKQKAEQMLKTLPVTITAEMQKPFVK